MTNKYEILEARYKAKCTELKNEKGLSENIPSETKQIKAKYQKLYNDLLDLKEGLTKENINLDRYSLEKSMDNPSEETKKTIADRRSTISLMNEDFILRVDNLLKANKEK